MEIYQNNTAAVVTIQSPLKPGVGDTITAVRGSVILHQFDPTLDAVADGFGNVNLKLPIKLILESQAFSIHWVLVLDGQTFRFVTDIEIVAPILSISEVTEITGAVTRVDAEKAERRVRYLIETITNSKFRPYSAAFALNSGGNVIHLPDRLLHLRSITFNSYSYPVENMIIGERTITLDPDKWLTIKSDYEGVPGAYPQSIVWNPYRHNAFSSKITYLVDGIWGYASTPPAVQEAARLLLKDYGCNENLWRQRGLESISVGESRFQYSDQTFVGTGNLDADRLLSGYRKSDIFII